MKFLRRLSILLFFLTALPVPEIRAEGGIATQPYWTFPTDAPITHIATGDINGDGTPEVVMTTADSWLYVLENDGRLTWRYELEAEATTLLVADVDGDGQVAEIWVGSKDREYLFSATKKPIWKYIQKANEGTGNNTLAAFAIDLNGDGRPELLSGHPALLSLADITGMKQFLFIEFTRPVVDIWAGEVDGDERPEIVPTVVGGNLVYVRNDDGSVVWEKTIEGEVYLVQAGDIDGDGRAEIVVLNTSGELSLWANDGQQVWHQKLMPVENRASLPLPGQLIIHDLDGDGRMEIILLAPAGVQVFKGDGSRLWQYPLSQLPGGGTLDQSHEGLVDSEALESGFKPGLQVADIDNDGQAEIVVARRGQGSVYLLSATGQRLAEYLVQKITGALVYADLNGDGRGEIMVGTERGLQVFGAARQAERRELWQSRFLNTVTALELTDLDGDGRNEIVAGSQEGQISVLAGDGHTLWQVNLPAESSDFFKLRTVLALSAGNVDGDGQPDIIANEQGSQILLLDSKGPRWSVPSEGKFITSLAVHDLDRNGRAEIILGGDSLLGSASVVRLLDGAGKLVWDWDLTGGVTAVALDEEHILVGTGNGQVFRLTSAGTLAGEYNLGNRVLSLGAGQAITGNGQIYRLDNRGPTLVHDLGVPLRIARLSTDTAAIVTGEQEINLVTGSGLRWQTIMDSRVLSLALGDLNGDGEAEVAVGTNDGRVHLFGLAVNQPPLLTNPVLAETRSGYAYGVDINEPDSDTVTVTVEIWDPSAGVWITGAAQPFNQGQSRLNLDVPDPFDTWDSGQESRFRFRYDDGHNQGVLKETPGPFTIPTQPWYIYYGQWVGLGVLILLPVTLGFVFYRRQRAYRHSPVGMAESLLKQLHAHPNLILSELHKLARDDAGLLTHLPGLAREAGQTTIADLSEGLHLLLVRPELTGEDLRKVKDAIERLDTVPLEHKSVLGNRYDLFLRLLEANTVSRIVSLSTMLTQPESAEVPDAVETPVEITETLQDLSYVVETLNNSQWVELVEDKMAYLAQAFEVLGRLGREFQTRLAQPERNILARIVANWTRVTTNALQDLQGRAQIDVALKSRRLLNLEQATLALELTNTGRSPASNISVALVPDQTFAVSNGRAHLDILPAGRSAIVELPIAAAPSVEQFRAEFAISFDDRERSGKSLAFADLVRLLKPAPFQTLPNPYAPGTPLRPGSSLFFGRDDLFQFIAENMNGLARQNILVLIGQRRMGKTSFLQQLPDHLGADYLPVYLDGQSLGIDPGMANFFSDLALAITDALTDAGLQVVEPEPEMFRERPSRAFEKRFLPAVFEAVGRRQLLLLFDEFEELEMRVASGRLEPTIFPFFRHLMQHGDKLGFIFVGTHRLEELSADYWSILFNIALYKRVTFLSEVAARTLVVEPVAAYGLVYDDLALDKIWRVTAGHPYFLQLLCHALVNHANRVQRNYMTIQDVNEVLGELVELGEAHFAFLWEQSNPPERLILAALMRLAGQEPTVTAGQIVEMLAERGVVSNIQVVIDGLRRLAERDIVREIAGQPPRYEYKIELVRLWVEQYKALSRVIEETKLE